MVRVVTSSWQALRSLSRRSTADEGPDRFIAAKCTVEIWIYVNLISRRFCLLVVGFEAGNYHVAVSGGRLRKCTERM